MSDEHEALNSLDEAALRESLRLLLSTNSTTIRHDDFAEAVNVVLAVLDGGDLLTANVGLCRLSEELERRILRLPLKSRGRREIRG